MIKLVKKTKRKTDAELIVEGLRDIVMRSKMGLVETYELIYISNLLENGLIDSYKKGKITRERLDNFLYRDQAETVLGYEE